MQKTTLIVIASLFLIACSDNHSDPEVVSPTPSSFSYIGLKEQSNVRDAQNKIEEEYRISDFWPYLKVYEEYLYVSTSTGIYRKSITSLNNTFWESYAFSDYSVSDFVKSGSKILASTPTWDEKGLLFSEDDGRSFKAIAPKEWEYDGKLWDEPAFIPKLCLNSDQLAAIVIPYGIFTSNDWGSQWNTTSLTSLSGYQNRFIGINSIHPNIIYYAGEHMTESGFLYAYHKGSQTWETLVKEHGNCIHHLAYHPTRSKEMIYSAEGHLGKTTDRGKTWKKIIPSETHFYYYKTIYDPKNPKIIYTTGIRNTPEYYPLTVFISTDSGDTWSKFSEIELEGGVVDMELLNDKLYLYTLMQGIYCIEISTN